MEKKFKKSSTYLIQEDMYVKITDPSSLEVGHKHEGWKLIKKYEHFNLWERKAHGESIRNCFHKYELPKAPKLID